MPLLLSFFRLGFFPSKVFTGSSRNTRFVSKKEKMHFWDSNLFISSFYRNNRRRKLFLSSSAEQQKLKSAQSCKHRVTASFLPSKMWFSAENRLGIPGLFSPWERTSNLESLHIVFTHWPLSWSRCSQKQHEEGWLHAYVFSCRIFTAHFKVRELGLTAKQKGLNRKKYNYFSMLIF